MYEVHCLTQIARAHRAAAACLSISHRAALRARIAAAHIPYIMTCIVHPDEKLVPRDARCVRDACAQRCSLNLDTVDLTRTKLAHQARAAVVRGILPRDSNAFLGGRLQT